MGHFSRLRVWVSDRFWGAFDNVVSSAILIAALTGAGALILWIWNANWPLVIVFATVSIMYGTLIWFYRKRLLVEKANAEDALHKTEKLADAQLDFTVNLASFVRRRHEPTTDIKPVFEVFLRDLTEIFSNTICRASIRLPDKDSTSLEILAHYNMPPESIMPARFPIDNRFATSPSVAGHTYLRREVIVIKIFRQAGVWTTNRPDIYQFRISNMSEPAYKSFASVPIMDSGNLCLGVLCIDSTNPTTFDGDSISDLLYEIGVNIAAGLVIHHHISDPMPTPD